MNLLFYGRPIAEVARATGLSYQCVYRHAHGQRAITPECALRYEAALGIPRHLLRPDLWPATATAAPATQTPSQTKGDTYDPRLENLPF